MLLRLNSFMMEGMSFSVTSLKAWILPSPRVLALLCRDSSVYKVFRSHKDIKIPRQISYKEALIRLLTNRILARGGDLSSSDL
jgi:hypothetical protein